jgi:hypothetical protein
MSGEAWIVAPTSRRKLALEKTTPLGTPEDPEVNKMVAGEVKSGREEVEEVKEDERRVDAEGGMFERSK